MKGFVKLALMLCIATMCVSPQSVQGQNRRTGVLNNSNSSKNERVEKKTPQQNQPQSRQQQYRQQTNRASAPVKHYEYGRTVKPRPAPASIYHYGYCATVLPKGAYRRVYNGINYYYVDNVFYRPYGNTYIVCRPPVGATFAHAVIGAALTALIVRNTLDNSRYYYNNGVYYSRRNDRYTVIEAPVGALVSQLPDGYEEVVIDGNLYYQVDNVLYKTTVYSGLPYFEVAAVL